MEEWKRTRREGRENGEKGRGNEQGRKKTRDEKRRGEIRKVSVSAL